MDSGGINAQLSGLLLAIQRTSPHCSLHAYELLVVTDKQLTRNSGEVQLAWRANCCEPE